MFTYTPLMGGVYFDKDVTGMTYATVAASATDVVANLQYRLACQPRAVTASELLAMLRNLKVEAGIVEGSYIPKQLRELFRDATTRSQAKQGTAFDGPYSLIGLQWTLDRIQMDFAAHRYSLTE